jgi:hypothetical protein
MQASFVACRSTTAVAFVLLLAASGAAQDQEQRWVNIVLLGGVPSEKVQINYVLYGPFGAHGGSTAPKPDSPSYQIPTSVDGKLAHDVKGVIWASGCKLVTFDTALPDSASVQEYFSCRRLGTIALVGRIDNPLLCKKPVEVRVDYLASWECDFFGLWDCEVPQIELGTVRPDADGAFEIELPDFSSDPTASGSAGGAQLQIVLREVKTWNRIAFLEPQTESLRALGGLKILPSYPNNMVFSARKTKR